MSDPLSAETRTPFPVACLPSPYKEMSLALAGLFQCSPNLPGMCVLGAMNGAAANRYVAVNPITKDHTPSNIYIMGVGQSGDGKSRVMTIAYAPLLNHEAAMAKKWREEIEPGARAEKKLIEGEIQRVGSVKKSIVKAEKAAEPKGPEDAENMFAPSKPLIEGDPQSVKKVQDDLARLYSGLAKAESMLVPPRLIVDDVTPEKLVSLMQHANCLISASAEARKVMDVLMGRYSPGKGEQTGEDVYLRGFSGDPIKVDRVTGGTTEIRFPCLCILWLTQPGKAEQLWASHNMRDSGFLQRCLIGYADSNAGNRLNSVEIPQDVHMAYVKSLEAIMSVESSPGHPQLVQMTREAAIRVNDVHEALRQNWRKEDDVTRSFECRYAEHLVRIALTLHVGRYGVQSASHMIGFADIENAIKVLGYFTQNHRMLLVAVEHSQEMRAQEEVARLLKMLSGAFTYREATRCPLGRMFPGNKLDGFLGAEVAEGRLFLFKDGRTERYTNERHRLHRSQDQEEGGG
jgi:hypothetical protein